MHKAIWEKVEKSNATESQLSVCPTIQQALELIHDIKDNNSSAHVNVLFTGSLHLIGSTLTQLNHSVESKIEAPIKAKRVRS